MTRSNRMKLVRVDEENFSEIIKIKVRAEELGFVDSPLYSLAECFLDYEHMEAFGIYSQDVLVGFISIYFEGDFGQIINFLIADDFQNRSYGTQAAGLILDMFRDTYKVATVSVGIHKRNQKAFRFWRRMGFVETGNLEGDYEYYRKPLKEIKISDELFLANYFPAYNISLNWYRDKDTVKMVDNSDVLYDLDQLKKMYGYLDKNGDLFYIVYKNKLIGDCAIFDDNMVAIVLSKEYRGQKFGSKVLEGLVSYAREKKLAYIKAEIYDFNNISRKLFAKYGFERIGDNLYGLSLDN